jgi:hypothetical protein
MTNAFDAKRIPDISTAIFPESRTLHIVCRNGDKLILELDKLPADILDYAALVGLKEKLLDASALARSTVTGRSASLDEKFSAMKAVFDRLTGPLPTWNAKKAAPASPDSIFLRAVCEYRQVDSEKAKAFLATLTKAQIASIKLHPDIRRIMDRMASEALADESSDDVNDLLDSLS